MLTSHQAWRSHSNDKGDREGEATWWTDGRPAGECQPAGVIDAARRRKARAEDGPALAPGSNTYAGIRGSAAGVATRLRNEGENGRR